MKDFLDWLMAPESHDVFLFVAAVAAIAAVAVWMLLSLIVLRDNAFAGLAIMFSPILLAVWFLRAGYRDSRRRNQK